MKKIDKIRDDYGEIVIRVWKCDNFHRVPQDLPIFIIKNLHNSGKVRNARIYDIIQEVENYCNNSGK